MTGLQHFGWFLSRGFGPHGWGQPYLDWNYIWQEPELYQQSARELEQAGLDLVIIEDALSLGTESTLDLRVRGAYGGPKHDPLSLTPYLFQATRHLGVVPTVNPLQFAPYQAARQFASLHHLSRGRLGLNVVTDVGSSRHFGLDPVPHDFAYDRAEEWLGGIRELWHSWGEGALLEDRQSKIFADGSRLDALRHRGEHWAFDGPLNALPFDTSAGQLGDPVVVSPGSSPRGLAFTGRNSDVQLALSPLDVPSVRAYRARVASAAQAVGQADPPLVLFVFKPIVTSSADEADRIVAASASPSEAKLREVALGWSSDLDTDLTELDLDTPVDPAIFGDHVSRGTLNALLDGAESFTSVTLRELLAPKARLKRIRPGETGPDGGGQVGTAEEIADFIELLGEETGNDGLIFAGDLHPVTVHRTLDELVPELRRRGVLRREFGGGGLRANLTDF
ncbi:LLM class flavin-dependent oxidoreductase [Subtercola lobariae]|uniref:Dibenzothiophene desulfurization enzyme A n=1 Tax=Subtercola lobariae TaxID=1588641 RepID=A0A917EVI2_9MICO|nr:LLM class flavin-dependent oxidoreductase [Subtercola lobariae]GGF22263.1 dibenzothiophene desulfurization enzyme A [Subtercola lobariae]